MSVNDLLYYTLVSYKIGSLLRNINSSQVLCTSANVSFVNCTRTIIVSVNEAEFSNSAVTYLYKPDPTFSSLSPQITIPA